jgi:tRNA (cmo5U34)-methyltransferase
VQKTYFVILGCIHMELQHKYMEMEQFFAIRVDGYEEHMSPWKDYYKWMAQIMPQDAKELLDIGCGTGLYF